MIVFVQSFCFPLIGAEISRKSAEIFKCTPQGVCHPLFLAGENDLSYKIRGTIYQTYKVLGPGLLESSYEAVLKHLLENDGLSVEKQVAVPLFYGDVKLDVGYIIDLLVNNKVIIEIKSVELIQDVRHKQLLIYLRLSDKKLGLLVNFNIIDILKSIYRKVNGL